MPRRIFILLVAALLAVALAAVGAVASPRVSAATTLTWTGNDAPDDSAWSDTGNWSTAAVPADGDTLIFPSTASAYTTQDDIPSLQLAGITFGAGYQLSQNSGDVLEIEGPITTLAASGQVIVTADIELGPGGATIENLDTGSSPMLFLGSFTETGGPQPLTVEGPGTVDFQTTDTYTGTTTVDGASSGYLLLDGTSVSSVTVQDGATLGGDGTGGDVTVDAGGTLSPGHSPGHISVGALTLTGTSTLLEQINGTTAGTLYDETSSTGPVTLGGATLTVVPGFTPTDGDQFTVIDNSGAGAVSGTFNGLAEGSSFTAGGDQFRITYAGGDGNDVVLTAIHTFASTTTLTSAPNPSDDGTTVTFTATVDGGVNGTPTGSVTFEDGATVLGTATLNGAGVATFTTSALATGSHAISATYAGDNSFVGSTDTLTQVVDAVAVTVPVPSTGAASGDMGIPPFGVVLLLAGLALLATTPRRRHGEGRSLPAL